jgi:hypothetical protein
MANTKYGVPSNVLGVIVASAANNVGTLNSKPKPVG